MILDVDAPEAPGSLNFQDPQFQRDPWPLYDWHLRHAPVSWSEEMKCHFLFGHENVRYALTSSDFTTFSVFRRSRAAFGHSLVESDGSDHRRMRGLMSGPFRPRAVASYDAELVRPTVRPLLEELLRGGRTDFPDELAWRLPYTIASRLLGVPPEDAGRLFEMAQPLLHYVDHAPVGFGEVIRQREDLRAYMRHAAAHCEGARAMLRILTDGGLDEIDVLSNGIQLLIAATETTRTFIVNLLARLAVRPDVLASLRAGFGAAEAVLNETLRHEPPLHFVLRFATRDLELDGQSIPRGAPVQVCLASANRDPARYPDPHVWDPARTGPTPLTFGKGRHHCLGIGVARLELTDLLRNLCDLVAELWIIAPDPPVPTGRTFRRVRGLELGYRLAKGA